MTDRSLSFSSPRTSSAPAGTFDGDSLVWSLGRLAERIVRHFLRQPGDCARYARWLSEEAPRLAASAGLENGLLATAVSLGDDGALKLLARPTRGQFLLVIEHRSFEAVMAIAHGSLRPSRQPEGVCLAHFEGDAALAARWALGAGAWLSRRWRAARDEERRGLTLN
jgi:hypothetical protein